MFDSERHIAEVAYWLLEKKRAREQSFDGIIRGLQTVAQKYLNSDMKDIFSEDQDAVMIADGDIEISNIELDSSGNYIIDYVGDGCYKIIVGENYWYSNDSSEENYYAGLHRPMGSVNKRIFTEFFSGSKCGIFHIEDIVVYFHYKKLKEYLDNETGTFEDFKLSNKPLYQSYIVSCEFIHEIMEAFNRELSDEEVSLFLSACEKLQSIKATDLKGFADFVNIYGYRLGNQGMMTVLSWRKRWLEKN